ncbi:hypothetical protein AVEN_182397-1 [Araneus ventricosus]|uniref:Uncharacterized protein n=1 Tax=Araneus ventricosus TaxID=182803 RepID=A0A4Y2X2J4_ARAVE|nr:hypothetical protein AVEN_238487-1 [Araneus ventricosus]GBO43408.1 hypothetical protein AVEN_182397-1 [Araneus ventricosus]
MFAFPLPCFWPSLIYRPPGSTIGLAPYSHICQGTAFLCDFRTNKEQMFAFPLPCFWPSLIYRPPASTIGLTPYSHICQGTAFLCDFRSNKEKTKVRVSFPLILAFFYMPGHQVQQLASTHTPTFVRAEHSYVISDRTKNKSSRFLSLAFGLF